MRKIIIAIDGFAGCGKSTTAKSLAQSLGYVYVDSGAMYRAFTLEVLRRGANPENPDAVAGLIGAAEISFRNATGGAGNEVLLNGEPVNHLIRTPEVNASVSAVSAVREVREHLVEAQQKLGENGGVVMDGRDIGTVVFPNAELKIFMTASIDARAARRFKELNESGAKANLDEVKASLARRDKLDVEREESPLRQADDARVLDTTELAFEEQTRLALKWARELISEKS